MLMMRVETQTSDVSVIYFSWRHNNLAIQPLAAQSSRSLSMLVAFGALFCRSNELNVWSCTYTPSSTVSERGG